MMATKNNELNPKTVGKLNPLNKVMLWLKILFVVTFSDIFDQTFLF